MNEELEMILQSMADAGCGTTETERAKLFFETGDTDGLVRFLRKCRCSRMDELHESQRKVDCLDFLIRRTMKSNT